MISSFPELNMLEKSVKLTSLLQSFHSFSSCVSDLSWLFAESLHVIQQFARQSAEYYRERKSKRIRIDSIEKEYLTLKLRFDAVDLLQIQRFVQQLIKQQSQRRKPSVGNQNMSATSRRDKKEQQSSTFRDQQTLKSSRANFILEVAERETMGKKQQQLSQKLSEKDDQMRHLNYQINCLKEQNSQFRTVIAEAKKHISLLTDIVYSKRVNQINAIEKIKSTIKILKDKNNSSNLPQLDRVLYGLIDFESRLKQDANIILCAQYYQPIESVQSRRNNIMIEINTIMRQINDLKDQKIYVQQQIQQLGDIYQQKKTDNKTLPTNNSLGCNCIVSEPSNEYMLLLQAIAIQKILGQN